MTWLAEGLRGRILLIFLLQFISWQVIYSEKQQEIWTTKGVNAFDLDTEGVPWKSNISLQSKRTDNGNLSGNFNHTSAVFDFSNNARDHSTEYSYWAAAHGPGDTTKSLPRRRLSLNPAGNPAPALWLAVTEQNRIQAEPNTMSSQIQLTSENQLHSSTYKTSNDWLTKTASPKLESVARSSEHSIRMLPKLRPTLISANNHTNANTVNTSVSQRGSRFALGPTRQAFAASAVHKNRTSDIRQYTSYTMTSSQFQPTAMSVIPKFPKEINDPTNQSTVTTAYPVLPSFSEVSQDWAEDIPDRNASTIDPSIVVGTSSDGEFEISAIGIVKSGPPVMVSLQLVLSSYLIHLMRVPYQRLSPIYNFVNFENFKCIVYGSRCMDI